MIILPEFYETNLKRELGRTEYLLLKILASATISGQKIKRMGVQKYVGRIKESKRTVRRHSSFYIGLYGHNWVNFIGIFGVAELKYELVAKLLALNPHKYKCYQQGDRAMKLTVSAF
ncbi:MAG: hypothetical protein KME55_37740 [Nostoc indistinguendum CM1-VF10]|nr:hypothetical protein [Nostoc indistinguendum CM1-VF10]